jgi:hypothetical protein
MEVLMTRKYSIRFTIRTILRSRFEDTREVKAYSLGEALKKIRHLYGPRLLEILEARQAWDTEDS